MFTLPDKLPHDDQLPALEYVFHLATLIEDGILFILYLCTITI